ncbi:tyrosine-type recombinase/integrase [Robertmurraya sp. FSL R5-0851]|uniref:tyrosine-type recombinase/integrase n=1 Tax=Robertmurraya sp. FSL R5-0851 TaxID=2921584 RepID=UPI0030FA4B0E
MRVQEVIFENKNKRYMLLDDNGVPIITVIRYLKFLEQKGKSSNTQKTYCYALKHYFQFLQEKDLDYRKIKLEYLVEFIGWLRIPKSIGKVTPIKGKNKVKSERTINLIITVITAYYDFLYRNEEISIDLVEKLNKKGFVKHGSQYKDFLYHITKGTPHGRNILKLKEPKKKRSILTKEEIQKLLNATTNIRDKFLLQLLFETGLRIGEALSLFIEDFVLSHKDGHRIKLVDRGELINGASLKTGEREIHISQSLIDIYDDYLYEVIDEHEIKSNFLFIKLKGTNVGEPMNYQDVASLFKRLRTKTDIKVNPHLFRHTHGTIFYRQSKNIKQVQERLGHSNIQTTMNMYVHPSDEEIREEWEKSQHAFQLANALERNDL